MNLRDLYAFKLSAALKFTGIASVILLASCATLRIPDADVMRLQTADFQLPQQPEANNAIVYVIRPSARGGMIRFNVFVDDKLPASEVAYTYGGQYIFFSVAPGKHTIYSKADNWASIDIEAKAGQVIFLRQEPAAGTVFSGNSLFSVESHEGKYGVKNLPLGTLLKQEK